MSEHERADPRAVVVTLVTIGAILNIIEAVYVISAGVLFLSLAPQAAGDVVGIGATELILGLVLVVLAFLYYNNPEIHVGLGTVMIIVAAITFWVGGGFGVGSILALIGAIFAVALPHSDAIPAPPPPAPIDEPAFVPRSATGIPADDYAAGEPTKLTNTFTAATIVRYCLTCNEQNPPENLNCSKCGTPLPVRSV